MDTKDNPRIFEKNAIEVVVKVCILLAMVVWTFFIIKPFLVPVLWGIIIAVTMEPFIGKFAGASSGRRKFASIVFALVVIAALIIPAAMLILSSIDVVHALVRASEAKTLTLPPPPSAVEQWPLIGPSLFKFWSLASSNLAAALAKFTPQLKSGFAALLSSVGGGVKVIFMFIISTVIAAALLITAEKGSATMTKIVARFVGEQGKNLIALGSSTIRGVMQGVVGVAVIQSVLAAIGMVVVGVPGAGVWAVMVLICAVIQLPPVLVLGPVAAWVFSASETLPAVLFLIWALLVSGCDSVLKPILMGRGVDIPMLVLLIGALGGMMLSGIIGLFVGAVVVAISYTLIKAWVDEQEEPEEGTH